MDEAVQIVERPKYTPYQVIFPFRNRNYFEICSKHEGGATNTQSKNDGIERNGVNMEIEIMMSLIYVLPRISYSPLI